MSVGFEKTCSYITLLYMKHLMFSSFVYRYGLLEGITDSTAVGLFNSVVNFTPLALTNN